MCNGKWVIAGLLILSVVLTSETNEIDDPPDTCVWVGVEVNFDHGHNNSETSCEAPEKPVNGGYKSETGVHDYRYHTGDIIQYYCSRGNQLIGHANRTCNGTLKEWQPDEPYCEPEYIGHLMRRLNGIEDQMRAIEYRISTVENNTLQVGHNISAMRNELKVMDNRVLTINNKVIAIENSVTSFDNKVSFFNNTSALKTNVSEIGNQLTNPELQILAVGANVSLQELPNPQLHRKRERLIACTNATKDFDEDTVSKCMTMQLGVRNESSVSVFTWVIENFKSKVNSSRWVPHYSPVFYHTVPGYKLRLRANIDYDAEVRIYLLLLPGEHDNHLTWPFSNRYDITVMKKDSTEVLYKYFSGDKSTCKVDRPITPTSFNCYDYYYTSVYIRDDFIFRDGSAIIKFYMYN